MSSLSQIKYQRGKKPKKPISNSTSLDLLMENEKPDSMFGTSIYANKSTSGLIYFISLDAQQVKHDPALASIMGERKKKGGTQFNPADGEERMQDHKDRIAPTVCDLVKNLVESPDPSVDYSKTQLLDKCKISDTEEGFITYEKRGNKVYVSYHCWSVES